MSIDLQIENIILRSHISMRNPFIDIGNYSAVKNAQKLNKKNEEVSSKCFSSSNHSSRSKDKNIGRTTYFDILRSQRLQYKKQFQWNQDQYSHLRHNNEVIEQYYENKKGKQNRQSAISVASAISAYFGARNSVQQQQNSQKQSKIQKYESETSTDQQKQQSEQHGQLIASLLNFPKKNSNTRYSSFCNSRSRSSGQKRKTSRQSQKMELMNFDPGQSNSFFNSLIKTDQFKSSLKSSLGFKNAKGKVQFKEESNLPYAIEVRGQIFYKQSK